MASANPERSATRDADAAAVSRALRLASFFPEFTGEQCAKIFPRSGVAVYEAGELLIEQGESGRDLFVILQGSVSVTLSMGSAGAEVGVFSDDALLGEVALVRDGLRSASATAVERTRAFRLMFEDMGYLLQHHGELAAHLKALAIERTS